MFDNLFNSHLDSKTEIETASDILFSGLIGIYVVSTTELTYLFTWATALKLFWAFGFWAGSLAVKSVGTEIWQFLKPIIINYFKAKLIKYKFIRDEKKRNKKAA